MVYITCQARRKISHVKWMNWTLFWLLLLGRKKKITGFLLMPLAQCSNDDSIYNCTIFILITASRLSLKVHGRPCASFFNLFLLRFLLMWKKIFKHKLFPPVFFLATFRRLCKLLKESLEEDPYGIKSVGIFVFFLQVFHCQTC